MTIYHEKPNLTVEDTLQAFMIYEGREQVTLTSTTISPLKDPGGDIEEERERVV